MSLEDNAGGNPKQNLLRSCCISHEFHRAAFDNPNKIAVIHAFGGARVARERRNNQSYDFDHNHYGTNHQLALEERSSYKNHNLPPVYEGDECFTYADLLSAVDSISVRLRNVLNGGDDPSSIRPTSGNAHTQNLRHTQICLPSGTATEQSSESLNRETKRIIGVYMSPSVEYIVAVLSVLRCGEAFMPLDTSWPQERILSILSSSNVDLIIGCKYSNERKSSHQLNEAHWLLDCCLCPVMWISMDVILEEKSGHLHLVCPCETRRSKMFCYLMYTSGSTGMPKGVCGTEKGLLNRFSWMQKFYPLHGEEILLFKTSISFIDHLQEFLAAMLSGCTLVVPPLNEFKANLFSLVDFLQDYSISRLIAVPSLMRTLIPAFQYPYSFWVQSSLKMLVLSGEVLSITLWRMISKLLPNTSILNLYGSTEVSGDCTYFDCKRLPMLLESEILSSVPIGVPITNCNVTLFKDGASNEGEICVTGICLSSGYFSEHKIVPLDCMEFPEDSLSDNSCTKTNYFRTGDFARQLPSGDLVFLGRKDRTVKVNGQRIALEEIEDTLRGHLDVVDAAVVSHSDQGKHAFLRAFLVLKENNRLSEILKSVRSWMVNRLPSAMIPAALICTDALPMSSTGKIDYTLLSGSFSLVNDECRYLQKIELIEQIKKAFSDALVDAKVGNDDDFFVLGGDSIAAAHVAYNLGIDIRLLHMFPSPSKLEKALLENEGFLNADHLLDWEIFARSDEDEFHSLSCKSSDIVSFTEGGRLAWTLGDSNVDYLGSSKRLKVSSAIHIIPKDLTILDRYPWQSNSTPRSCAFSRCNKVMYNGNYEVNDLCHQIWEIELPRNSRGILREMWKVHMDSCVDASPVIVMKGEDILLFIGSHSHKFLCINAKSGFVLWEIELEGRIECSAVIDGDFSQMVIGCYKGRIYFVDYLKGNICWTFQTCGEVKSQPTVDERRHLVWCGSHDHNLYGLDYRNHCCVYQFACGGSIFSSPAISEVVDILFVVTTNGRLTAISLKGLSFSKLWLLELEAPVFGSLAISSSGNVICCLVNGHVVAVDYKGSIVWMVRTGGPIFAGACISCTLPSQALICCRNGSVYSVGLEDGKIAWEYNVGDPITASAYVDEYLKLTADPFLPSDRVVCICSSSGKIHLLRIGMLTGERSDQTSQHTVEKFAQLDLQGDVFSSPVMLGGRIFVGCRDDYVHCIVAEAHISAAK
ncbi:hypothetical protein Nepgr_002517 [Nepenthes gracilis]|uniref:4-coumarate--CoA ligase n=1 Tax=Nepenthes gracilis TaxID=150966 RepID=A0AAD3RYA6_NEPGR|nr:hypothetical protein Nepgr_002517 [Nepenthes gracilis]